jgi:hypothetical protein
MRLPVTLVCSAAAVLISVTGTTAFADGSAALDDGKAAPATGEPGVAATAGEKPVEYGVGLRLRNVRIPKGEIELFLERAGDDGSSTLGLGVDFIRRRGNVELQLGLEYDKIRPGSGMWIESGKNIAAGDVADYVLPDQNLAWFTIEFTFLNHAPINKYVSVRYGGGAGLGIVLGDLTHFNMVCNGTGATNENPQPCEPVRFGGQGQFEEGTETLVKYNLPPVFPVVNAIIGLQIKPMEKLTINIEGGIRTFLFFGTSAAYFF